MDGVNFHYVHISGIWLENKKITWKKSTETCSEKRGPETGALKRINCGRKITKWLSLSLRDKSNGSHENRNDEFAEESGTGQQDQEVEVATYSRVGLVGLGYAFGLL